MPLPKWITNFFGKELETATPLSLTIEQNQEALIEVNNELYQALLLALSNDPNYAPSTDDIKILKDLVYNYCLSGQVECYEKIVAVLNAPLIFFLKEANGDIEKTMKSMEDFLRFPVTSGLMDILDRKGNEAEKEREIFDSFTFKIQSAFKLTQSEAHKLLADFKPFRTSHFIMAAPRNLHVKDTVTEPYISLSTLAYPDYIDAVLSKVNPAAYKKVKADPQFQKTVSEMVAMDKKETLKHNLRVFCRLYTRNCLDVMLHVPHLFYNANRKIVMFPAKVGQQLLPHLFFNEPAKRAYSTILERTNYGLQCVLAPIVGMLMLEKVPEFKDWTVLSKFLGKDPGFIAESPDTTQRVYFKSTHNMVNEFFAAKLLNQLGLKMAETSLFVDDHKNCFLATRGLSRQYTKKTGVQKQKFFQPLAEALPEPAAYSFGDLQEKIYGTKDEQLKKMKDFVQHLYKDDLRARISFAKLALIGFVMGLSDIGGHGGNIGPLSSLADKKSYNKFGIVDYQFHPCPIATFKSLDELFKTLKTAFDHTVPIFRELLEQLTLEDLEHALEQLERPKSYVKSPENYLLTKDALKRNFEVAVDQAYDETIEELKSNGLWETLSDKQITDLMDNKKSYCQMWCTALGGGSV